MQMRTAPGCPLESAIARSSRSMENPPTIYDLFRWASWLMRDESNESTCRDIGSVRSVHLFRERKVPWNHEYAIVSFKNESGVESWLRVERAARIKRQWLQADSFGPILTGATLRETITFSPWKESLICATSPADEIASVVLRRGTSPRTAEPEAAEMFIHDFVEHLETISLARPEYQLFSANCRWFARMTLMGLAKRVERLGPSQLSLFLWRLKPSTFDHLHHEIQGDQFGGKQVEGNEGHLVHARSLVRVSKAHRDASRLRKALTSCNEALRVLHAMGSDSPERRGTIARTFLERFYVQRDLGNEEDSLLAIRQACVMIGDLCCDRDIREHYIPLLHSALSLLVHAPRPFPSEESSSIQGAREALDIWRKLYESDDLLFTTPYTSALFTLATSFEESGLPTDAAKTAQDAVDIFRGRYHDQQHDSSAVLPLTAAMFTQAELLTRIGRIDDALSILGQRVSLYRQVLTNPPRDIFTLQRLRANLGHTLLEKSQCAQKASLYKEACSADGEAVEIFRSLFAEHPLVYRSTLAEALSNWAGNLSQLGSENGFLALEPARNALLLWGGSPTWNPRNRYHHRRALATIDIIAICLVALCSTEVLKGEEHARQASLAAQHAITVWRELSNVDPVSSESEDGNPSLSLSDVMTNLATYHLQRPFYAGDHASLGVYLDAYRESVDIRWQRPS